MYNARRHVEIIEFSADSHEITDTSHTRVVAFDIGVQSVVTRRLGGFICICAL